MTHIKPFNALIYNQEKIRDLSKVVCPPYDVISEKERDKLYHTDDFNLVRILLPKEEHKDGKLIDKYSNAKLKFLNWQKEKIFVCDKNRAIYFYLQRFPFKGENRTRLGFIGLMRLKASGKSSIYPHEHTYQEHKDDRFALLKTVKANLSPIFTLFSDEKRQVNLIFNNYVSKEKPLVDIVDSDRIVHQVWRLDDVKLVRRLIDYMKNKNIFIADGHHRYEVACEYRDSLLRPKRKGTNLGNAGFNYIMTYFVDMNSQGLTVLPIHRLVKALPLDWKEKLEEFFNIEKALDSQELFLLMKKAASGEHVFGMYLPGHYYFLRLKNERLIDKAIEGDSYHYNRLDVALLKKLVFEKLLKISASDVTYIKEEIEAIEAVNNGKFKAVFFLSPTKLEQIKTIALNNEKMPQKSTFFYPKLLSGLLIHKF
ncbi:MAG: DUF1015 domain-containing protein [Candidatus Omnitrophota bacterium]